MKNLLVIIFSILYLSNFITAQESTKVLERKLKRAKGKAKIEILYKLSKAYLTKSTKKSIKYGKSAYKLAKKSKNKNLEANALNMIGTAYFNQANYRFAVYYYEKEAELRKSLNQKIPRAKTLYNIASAYEAYRRYKKAIDVFNETLKEAKKIRYSALIYKSYEAIIRINIKRKNFEDAFTYLQEYNGFQGKGKYAYKKKLAILETKYEDVIEEKKDKEYQLNIVDSTLSVVEKEKEGLVIETAEKSEQIDILNFDKKIKEEKIKIQNEEAKRRQKQILALVIFLAVILIFSILLFKLLKDKRKAYKQLAQKNAEINEKKEEIMVQAELLLERNKLIIEKKEEIETQKNEILIQRDVALKQKKEIIDSINYAKRIQNAIFPSTDYINKILHEYFILFKPRDIVSGDFYWVKQIRNFVIVAVADCTGHGVPGAFMSMLGTSYLNELVTSRRLDNAGEILNSLRNKVKTSLGQIGKGFEVSDGMDMALYIINTEKKELQFSGAFNPLYILRKDNENELIEIKADNQPISAYIKETDFTNHKFKLQKNDCLYTFSDGYIDQFGGKKGRKFRSKNFKQLLLRIYDEPMSVQKEILNQTIKAWMNNKHKQIDDIIVFGLRI